MVVKENVRSYWGELSKKRSLSLLGTSRTKWLWPVINVSYDLVAITEKLANYTVEPKLIRSLYVNSIGYGSQHTAKSYGNAFFDSTRH